MKRKTDNLECQHQVAVKRRPNKFNIPSDVFHYIFKFLMSPEDRMSLLMTSRRTLTTCFDNLGIMRKMKTTFSRNDKVRRKFVRNYGSKLRNVTVNVEGGAYRFLKFMLPLIPNVEQLSINLSENDAKIWKNVQPRKHAFSLPALKTLEVFKPVDLKVIISLAGDSIKSVKYGTEICDLTAIAEYLKNVQSFECRFPTAILPAHASPDLLTFNSITSIKISNVHCGSIRDLKLPSIKSIEISKLGWTDKYLRGFFDSISSVEHIKIDAVSSRQDIPDIIGEVVRLAMLKTFSLEHVKIFSIFINVEEQQVQLSDHIRENCEPILNALRAGYRWYQGE